MECHPTPKSPLIRNVWALLSVHRIEPDPVSPRIKAITNGINEQYHSGKDQLTAAQVGRLLRELGIKTKRYKKGYRVEVEESKEAWSLLQRQHPSEAEGAETPQNAETPPSWDSKGEEREKHTEKKPYTQKGIVSAPSAPSTPKTEKAKIVSAPPSAPKTRGGVSDCQRCPLNGQPRVEGRGRLL